MQDLSRREAITKGLKTLGFGIAATQVPTIWTAVHAGDSKNSVLSADQLKTLNATCDLMIPATDTPGALAAKVPAFIDYLMVNWAYDSRKKELKSILAFLKAKGVMSSDKKSTDVLKAIDSDAFNSKSAMKKSDRKNYRELKSLILFSYYSSEIGAAEELAYEYVPGPFKGDLPYSSLGRAWY